MRVLFFGDSITQGFWAVEHGWVDLIRKQYSESQFASNSYHGIFNLGVDADNSTNLKQRIKNEVVARTRPHHTVKPAVVIQIGINDSSESKDKIETHVDVDVFRENLRGIVAELRDLSSSIVFVGLTACDDARTNPASWGEYYYKNAVIKEYEAAMAEVAESEGLGFVPVFEEFKRRLDAGEDLLPDGLHPNDAGHQVVYEIVKPKIEELLS